MPLNYYLDGTTYQIDLYDSDPGFENTLNIRLDSGTKYASLSSDLSHPDATNLRVRINDITYAVLSSSGLYSVWAWGSNSVGQLSQGDIVDRSSPTQIGSDTDWSDISISSDSILALKTDGTLWAWGNNSYGELGQGDFNIHRSSPVQIGADTDWRQISAESFHSLAIKTDGTLWAWGLNANGQLGQGDIINRSSPVQIGSDTTWIKVSSSKALKMVV